MNDMRRSELSRKVCGWIVRGGIATEGEMDMGVG